MADPIQIQWDDTPPPVPRGTAQGRTTSAAPPPPETASIQWDDGIVSHTANERGQRIEAPESFLHMAAREGLPLAGAALGGVAGAPLGPLGVAGGGVGGYTLGRQAFRTGEAFLNPHRGPQTPLETAGEVAKDVGTGMAMESVGPLAGRLLRGGKALFQRLAGSEPPSIARDAVLEAAKRQQIPLTVSAESGSRTAGALERFPERMLFGGTAVPQAREATRKGAERAVGRVAESVGGGIPSEVGGAAVQQDIAGQAGARRDFVDRAISTFADSLGGVGGLPRTEAGAGIKADLRTVEQGARAEAKPLYEAAYASVPEGAMVTHTNTATTAGRLLEQEQRLQGVARPAVARPAAGLATETPDLGELARGAPPAVLQSIIEQYGLGGPGQRSLTDTVEIMQRLRGFIRRQPDDSTRRGLRELAGSLSQDIDAFAAQQGGQFADKLRQADAFYRQAVAEDFARGGALRALTSGRPGQIAQKIFSMRDPDQIGRLMARMPEAGQDQVRRGVFEQLVQRSTKNGEVNPQALGRAIDQLAPDVRATVFGPHEGRLAALRQELARGGGAAPPEQALMRLAPDQVVRALTQGSAGNVGDLPRIWPSLSTQTQGRVRQALVQGLIDDASKGGVFSPARFLTAKRKIPDSVMPVIMGENPDRALNAIARVLQRVERFDKETANPSGTAQAMHQSWEIIRGATALGRAVMGHGGPAAVGEVAALYAIPPALGKFMTSPMARKLFTPAGLATVRPEQQPAATLLRMLLVPVAVPSDQPTEKR